MSQLPATPQTVPKDPTAGTSSGTTTMSSKRISGRIASMHPPQHTAHGTNSVVNSKGVPFNESMEDSAQRRRSSSRSIKRKKFDDELVDSMSTSYPKQKTKSDTPERIGPNNEILENESLVIKPELPCPVPEKLSPVIIVNTPKRLKAPAAPLPVPTISSKKKSRNKQPTTAATTTAPVTLKYSEETNYWKPVDDLALIVNVEQTNDLQKVFQGVKFTCKFSYSDIEARWHSLLYDFNVKSLSLAAIRLLHPDIVQQIESKALFSEAEENLLKSIESRNEPSLDLLQECITANSEVFHSSRTPKILLKHWLLLRHYRLLSDQTLQPLPRHESVVSFSEMENTVRKEVEEELRNGSVAHSSSANSTINQEIVNGIRKNMLEIRMLENEIPKYQSLLDSITGIAPSDFDNQTFAVLRGRLVRYLMRSKEITIGRTTKDFVVDVDLSLEGPSTKISRLQAIISLQATGEFMMYNTGKRPIYLDSKPLLSDTSLRINHNSLVEFSTLKFIFLINQDLISNMRNEVLQVFK